MCSHPMERLLLDRLRLEKESTAAAGSESHRDHQAGGRCQGAP